MRPVKSAAKLAGEWSTHSRAEAAVEACHGDCAGMRGGWNVIKAAKNASVRCIGWRLLESGRHATRLDRGRDMSRCSDSDR